MAFLCQIGEKLGKKSSKMIDISNKNPVKDYGKPKNIFSSLLLFFIVKSLMTLVKFEKRF